MSVLERLASASSVSVQRPFADLLPRRRTRVAWGIAVATPIFLTLGAHALGSEVPPSTVLFLTLLVVVVAALLGGVRPALATIAVGLLAQLVVFGFPYGSLTNHEPAQVSVLIVFVVIGAGLGILVDELFGLTTEQAALRRIATLATLGVPRTELLSAVADEVGNLLAADSAFVGQLGPDGLVTILAGWGRGAPGVAVGERRKASRHTAAAATLVTAEPARSDDDERASPEARKFMRSVGTRSEVATPIVVEGRLWGVVDASSSRVVLPASTERRMLTFTDLVATAIANAESRVELAASRARIVAASDETRRRIERDLHDGVQQRLVSLALDVRAAQSTLPPAVADVRAELTLVVESLTAALDELREIARGIHPAILSEGGLGPALKTLARRAPVPVDLDVRVEDELPEGVEVAAYYAVSELVTNTAKHASASHVDVAVTSAGGVLHIVTCDDGIGGADPAAGSGLVGLRDRIETLGGTLAVRSPRGDGTAVEVALPLNGDRASHAVPVHTSGL